MPTEPPDELVEAVSSQLAGTDIPTRVVGEVLRVAHDAGLIVYRDDYGAMVKTVKRALIEDNYWLEPPNDHDMGVLATRLVQAVMMSERR